MIFYEEMAILDPEGIRIMEENEDISVYFPKVVPRKDGSLNKFYLLKVDKEEDYTCSRTSSRHYLIHRERFLSLLPLEAVLSWRTYCATFEMENYCWETIVEKLRKIVFLACRSND